MSREISAGLMMYRLRNSRLEAFLVHPGGPFYSRKDDGYWGIPKGLAEREEDLLGAAKREFEEETGIVPRGKFIALGAVTQKSGKIVHGWAFEQDVEDGYAIRSNTCEVEWPPRSGRKVVIPEADRAELFPSVAARKKINSAQAEFISRLEKLLGLE